MIGARMGIGFSKIPDLFPEFRSCKPTGERLSLGWWYEDDRKSRINCLKKCIEMTKDEQLTII